MIVDRAAPPLRSIHSILSFIVLMMPGLANLAMLIRPTPLQQRIDRVFACITDYASIYDDRYSKQRGDCASWNPILPVLIAEHCYVEGLTRLLDIGGGGGNLLRALHASRVTGITTDFRREPGTDILPLNLAEYSEPALAPVLHAIGHGRERYLATCLNVLEHIDREHLAAALRNLYTLTDQLLVVSISTRPSSHDNLFHCTILPLAAWQHLFEASGFHLRDSERYRPASAIGPLSRENTDHVGKCWDISNIFGDVADSEPRYLIFEKSRTPPDWTDQEQDVSVVTDIKLRRNKRAAFGLMPDRLRFNFNFRFPQEWSYFRPLLDVLPRRQVRFLLGFHEENDIRPAIAALLRRNGVAISEGDDFTSHSWGEGADEIVISAAESTVHPAHLASFREISLSRLHGCSTFLLQHGIWPRAFPGHVVTFASEYVLTWGPEEARRLNEGRQKAQNLEIPWGVLPPDQDRPIGSPKYADQLMDAGPELAHRFGADLRRYKHVIAIATKNLRGRWGLKNVDQGIIPIIDRLIGERPDTLFLVRPHPSDSACRFASLRHANLRILDETISTVAEVPFVRVLPRVDGLITPPSTLILDGAISDKPVFVYETGQPIEYDGIRTGPLSDAVSDLFDPAARARMVEASTAFRAKYGLAINDRFYSSFANLVHEAYAADRSVVPITALAFSVLKSELPRSGKKNQTRLMGRVGKVMRRLRRRVQSIFRSSRSHITSVPLGARSKGEPAAS